MRAVPKVETPPRVWGRQTAHGGEQVQDGNTPTGVGKTNSLSSYASDFRKHPHGCGEDPIQKQEVSLPERNTPTGVGKTVDAGLRVTAGWKHPHGCGEDAVAKSA